ncbi:unnamed protein product [Echinostoma caproni]|uniref:Kringle domain-containing protein n=1 Tax=Echinostoma caproni TaxID=27848 RepID=A0A183AVR7_9TREM|nr:unnamed protein product [Echinostoma caproni]
MAQQLRESGGGDLAPNAGLLLNSNAPPRPPPSTGRPTGDGSSESVDSSGVGPMRVGTTNSQTAGNKSFEPQYVSGYSRSNCEYSQQNEKWNATGKYYSIWSTASGLTCDA